MQTLNNGFIVKETGREYCAQLITNTDARMLTQIAMYNKNAEHLLDILKMSFITSTEIARKLAISCICYCDDVTP
jgi:hypothetical protein